MLPRTAQTALAAAGAAAAVALARRRFLRWGATAEEVARRLPGDDLVAADLSATRAIGIAAPPERVWPWLAQMGQGRGGLYSYDRAENLLGCDMHSADRVIPELQDVRPGDEFRLHPQVALTVARVQPGRALVVRGGVPMGEQAAPYDFTWSFVLAPTAQGATRLVIRERYAYRQRWARLLVEPVEAVSLVMTRRMLRGVRERAERDVAAAQG